jgi:PAS domain-containing protein
VLLLVPSEETGETEELMSRVAAGERIEHYETARRRKDGSSVPVSLVMSPILGAGKRLVGISTIAHDISDRKRAEQLAAEARQVADTRLAQLRATLDNLSEAVYVCDSEGKPLVVNPAFCQLAWIATICRRSFTHSDPYFSSQKSAAPRSLNRSVSESPARTAETEAAPGCG